MFHALLDPVANGGVGVAFTDRFGGVSGLPLGPLNLGRTDAGEPIAVGENFRLVREALGLKAVVTVHQVHGTAVLTVDAPLLERWRPGSELGSSLPGGASLAEADAMVTTEPGVGLCVRVADCVPVLLADPDTRVVAAAHAGRAGLAAGVLEAVVESMRAKGARAITAWVGPAVCGLCYEVPAEMRDGVAARVPEAWAESGRGAPSLDLPAGAHAVLARAGCSTVDVGGCTRESSALHSHRRDGGSAGRQAGICWLG